MEKRDRDIVDLTDESSLPKKSRYPNADKILNFIFDSTFDEFLHVRQMVEMRWSAYKIFSFWADVRSSIMTKGFSLEFRSQKWDNDFLNDMRVIVLNFNIAGYTYDKRTIDNWKFDHILNEDEQPPWVKNWGHKHISEAISTKSWDFDMDDQIQPLILGDLDSPTTGKFSELIYLYYSENQPVPKDGSRFDMIDKQGNYIVGCRILGNKITSEDKTIHDNLGFIIPIKKDNFLFSNAFKQ